MEGGRGVGGGGVMQGLRCRVSLAGRICMQERGSAEAQQGGGNQGSGSARRPQICTLIMCTLTGGANNGRGKHCRKRQE